jgi:putative oxidoreductase
VVIFPHGAQKLLGWFGGYGFSGTMGYFTDQVGLPWIIAFLVVIIEFFGSLALIVGAATRLAALGIGAVMAGAVLTVHGKVGFFMNWSGNQSGEGFEFHLLAIGIALALILVGGGRASVDGAISANSG